MTRGTGFAGLCALACAAAFVLTLLAAAAPQRALAVSANGGTSVTVNPDGTGQVAQYAVGRFRSAKSEYVVSFSVTFPDGTDVSAATVSDQTGTVSVSGQTVTFDLATPLDEKARFSIVIGGVVNPVVADQYEIARVEFETSHSQDGSHPSTSHVDLGRDGRYDITHAPYVSMTIVTPGAGQSVDFGSIDPGVSTPGVPVSVSVASSLPYTITRTLAGSYAELGLAITGTAIGARPAGIAVFNHVFGLTPPWTTDPQVPLTATVVYTVTQ